MLRKYSNSRTLSDNLKLGGLTAFSAGMVNVSSLLLFLSFSSNVTGHYAILAAELMKGNFYEGAVVFTWIFLFLSGGFVSNMIVIRLNQRNAYLAHALPIVLEILCLLAVAIYGDFFYEETLSETEILLAFILFAMGLQNGLTASISNFTVKTTHLTGITTDLAILFSMFTHEKYRNNKGLKEKAKLLSTILLLYLLGAIVSGFAYSFLSFKIFYIVILLLVIVIVYDPYRIWWAQYMLRSRKEYPISA